LDPHGHLYIEKLLMDFNYSELAREKMWSRIHLIPVLQAEEDRDLVRRHFADKAREKELLGSETSAYHSDRYVTPNLVTVRWATNTMGQVREANVRSHAKGCDEIGDARFRGLYILGH
jgi:hypothetical protein